MKQYMLARQPIFDAGVTVYGYELLYRNSTTNAYDPNIDGDTATKSVIADTFNNFGEHNILDGRRGFVNFTKSLLLSSFIYLLNPADFIIEILEDITPDEEIFQRLKDLQQKGYTFALDDYIGKPNSRAFLPYADIVKVDFMQLPLIDCLQLAHSQELAGKTLLAEKVETRESFETARDAGYSLFQGYFFARPTIFSKPVLEISSSTYLRAVHELLLPSPNFRRLSTIIRSDVMLTYKLLQHVNTLQYEHAHRIRSVSQAIVHMGVRRTYRWLLLTLMRDNATLINNELLKNALIRALFCENLCTEIGLPFYQDEAYIVGMFSIIDTLVQCDLRELLDEVSVSPVVQEALLEHSNVLYRILYIVLCYEAAQWDAVHEFASQYAMNIDTLATFYLNAVHYADSIFDMPL